MTSAGASTTEQARAGKRVGEAGDWLEVRGLPGWQSRRGMILEVLGRPGHERYRVKWDEKHESIVFPAADGVHVLPRSPA